MDEKINIPPDVKLEVVDGIDKGAEFTIDNKTITIGREDTCNFKLKDEHVSKKHAQIVFRGGHFTVIDLGSLNKTKVNDNVYVQKNLTHGDIISLGTTKIKFVWEDQDKTMGEAEDIPPEANEETDSAPDREE